MHEGEVKEDRRKESPDFSIMQHGVRLPRADIEDVRSTRLEEIWANSTGCCQADDKQEEVHYGDYDDELRNSDGGTTCIL